MVVRGSTTLIYLCRQGLAVGLLGCMATDKGTMVYMGVSIVHVPYITNQKMIIRTFGKPHCLGKGESYSLDLPPQKQKTRNSSGMTCSDDKHRQVRIKSQHLLSSIAKDTTYAALLTCLREI